MVHRKIDTPVTEICMSANKGLPDRRREILSHLACVICAREPAMPDITISIDEAILRAAKLLATKEGHTPEEFCRQAIERFVRERNERLVRYLELQARIDADPGVSGPQLPKESREEMHERRSERGPKR
jgi:hypothetical protein